MISNKDLGIIRSENARRIRATEEGLCIHMGCKNKAIRSHTFPENYLKRWFSRRIKSKELVYSLNDTKNYIENPNINTELLAEGNKHFSEISTSKSGSLHIFCKDHDSEIFKPIDQIPFDPSLKNDFLNFYRHFSYTYRTEKNYDTILESEFNYDNIEDSTIGLFKLASELTNKFKRNTDELDTYLSKIHSTFHEDGSLSEEKINSEFIIENYELDEILPWCASGTTDFYLKGMNRKIWVTLIIYPIPDQGSKVTLICDKSRSDDFDVLKKIFDDKYRNKNQDEFISLLQYFAIMTCRIFIINYNFYKSDKNNDLIKNLNHLVQLTRYSLTFPEIKQSSQCNIMNEICSMVQNNLLISE